MNVFGNSYANMLRMGGETGNWTLGTGRVLLGKSMNVFGQVAAFVSP